MIALHGAPQEVWHASAERTEYLPEAFAQDGFIHTTVGAEALAGALNRYLRTDPRPYVTLLIELDRVAVRWVIARYPGDPAQYPHIYGPLPREAVLAVAPIPRAEDGTFLPPELPAH